MMNSRNEKNRIININEYSRKKLMLILCLINCSNNFIELNN